MADQVLERFHRALIEEIQTQRPEYLTQPFTVAEIYQNLVPYGSHRDRIGVEMNGDYEDALVRLLAGEGGYLIVDSEPALESLQAELEAPNPNTGVYREYAAVDVRLNQAYLDLSAEAMDELPDLYEELEAEDPVTMTDLAPAEGNASADDLGLVPPGVDIFADSGGQPPATDSEGEREAAEVAGADDEDGSRHGGAPKLDLTVTDPPAAAFPAPDADAEGPIPAQETDSAAGPDPAAEVSERSDDAEGHGDGATGDGGDEGAAGDGDGDVADERRRPPLAPEFVEPEEESRAGAAEETDGRMGSVPGGTCLWCRGDLPERESLNFCPFCGTDVNVVPCPQCGDEVQPGWMFCASCGTEVAT